MPHDPDPSIARDAAPARPSGFASMRENVASALAALRANPLRTILSTLGVIIGVASLVAVLSVGDGLERTIREQIERTTTLQYFNLEPVTTEEVDGQAFPLDSFPQFTAADARDAARLPGLAALSAVATARAELRDASGRVRRLVSVTATTESRDEVDTVRLAAGRFLDAADTDARPDAAGSAIVGTADALPGVVLSHALAVRLASAGDGRRAEDALGVRVRLEEAELRVVGVLADSAGGDESAFVGLGVADRALPPTARPRPVLLLGRFVRVEDADSVRARVRRWADERFGPGTTRVRSNEGRLAQASQGILLFKLFLGAITGISLLVGGIGIMNVLLAAVSERTREIGIRRAVGARARDVQRQFLAESVAIAVTGSALGIALGLSASFGITALMRWRVPGMAIHASVSASTLLIAVGSAALTGLVFGTVPARRAARLDPVDAIRHE